jgi:YesN/AraC family two-component response regulator
MKVLIVEDEELAVKKLQKTLATVDSTAEVVGVANSIRASVKLAGIKPGTRFLS